MVRTRILLTYVDHTLTAGGILLVVSIIVGYDIDFARCIAKKIPDRTLKRSTLITFLCLVHGLCIKGGAYIMLNVDAIIDVHRTRGAGLMKANKNLIIQR